MLHSWKRKFHAVARQQIWGEVVDYMADTITASSSSPKSVAKQLATGLAT